MTIIVAGAGIGGLATALSLHDAGFTDVSNHEAVSEIRPLGVGINLLPHAVRELTELGLADQPKALGVATSSIRYYNRHGQEIWAEPRGRLPLAAVLGAPGRATDDAPRRRSGATTGGLTASRREH